MVLPEFVNNKLQNKVLYVLASAGTAPREALLKLGSSYSHVEKELQTLKRKKLVKLSNTRPTMVSLTPHGRQLLSEKCPEAYDWYMRITSGGRPGGTNTHKELRDKAALTAAIMLSAEVSVGPYKRNYEDVLRNRVSKYSAVDDSVFFYNKEFRLLSQKEGRRSVSRSTGVVFSPFVRGVVYVAPACVAKNADEFTLYKRVELEALNSLRLSSEYVYGGLPTGQRAINILIAGAETALTLLKCNSVSGGRWGIGAAVGSGAFGADFHWVLDSAKLGNLLWTTPAEFVKATFDEEEIALAEGKACEAICKGLQCYEFFSGNISKLWRIRDSHEDLTKVGIVCWASQVDFVKSFFGDEVKLRVRRE